MLKHIVARGTGHRIQGPLHGKHCAGGGRRVGQFGLEHLWFFKDVRGVNTLSTECMARGDANMCTTRMDLKNHCSLVAIGIRHRYHEI